MTQNSHTQHAEILARLRKERIQSLYHFTCVENLPGIRNANALCSKAVLQEIGLWPPPEPGGNTLSHSLDQHNDNWDRISLNFTPRTPMTYHKKQARHLCFFEIDPAVATRSGVMFTNKNAASTTDQKRAEGLAGLDLVNFNAVRAAPRPWDKEGWVAPVQAEILVPGRIRLDDILRIAFVSEASLAEAKRLWGHGSHPQFVVDEALFSDTFPGVSLGFSRLKRIFLTDENVDKATVENVRSSCFSFSSTGCTSVTLVAEIYGVAGMKAVVKWLPGGITKSVQFSRTSDYWHWPSISINELPEGSCSVEYRLGDVRWATIPFEVGD